MPKRLIATSLRMAAAAFVLMLAGIAPAAADECPRGNQVLETMVVYFAVNSTDIANADRERLAAAAARLKGNPNLEVCTLGQADKSGNADYNEKLALRRAEAVADALKADGLEDVPFQIKSRGEAFANVGFLKDLFGSSINFDSDRRVEVLFINR